jgi:hypothetical protein
MLNRFEMHRRLRQRGRRRVGAAAHYQLSAEGRRFRHRELDVPEGVVADDERHHGELARRVRPCREGAHREDQGVSAGWHVLQHEPAVGQHSGTDGNVAELFVLVQQLQRAVLICGECQARDLTFDPRQSRSREREVDAGTLLAVCQPQGRSRATCICVARGREAAHGLDAGRQCGLKLREPLACRVAVGACRERGGQPQPVDLSLQPLRGIEPRRPVERHGADHVTAGIERMQPVDAAIIGPGFGYVPAPPISGGQVRGRRRHTGVDDRLAAIVHDASGDDGVALRTGLARRERRSGARDQDGQHGSSDRHGVSTHSKGDAILLQAPLN